MVNPSNPNPTKYQVRSASFPCRSHPSAIRIEQELNELKKWEASCVPSEKSISDGLVGLSRLYLYLDDFLNLSSTQETISHILKGQWVDGLLDGSMRVLDICGMVKDMVSQIKGKIINLQCVLRRRNSDSSIENNIASYITFRKKTKKDSKRLIADLKKVKSIIGLSSGVLNLDHHVISVTRVIVEVNEIMVSVLESILLYFTTLGFKSKQNKWPLVSKLMQKGATASEDQEESVDVALFNICRNGSCNEGKKLQTVQKRLMAFEVDVGSTEKGLEGMFRHLIRTRASLLNITSH